jgi:hypothetical protein
MGEDDSGFSLLGHVAAPHQLGLPRGLPASVHCGERRSRASHGRIVTEVRVRGEEAARERGHSSLLHDSRFLQRKLASIGAMSYPVHNSGAEMVAHSVIAKPRTE